MQLCCCDQLIIEDYFRRNITLKRCFPAKMKFLLVSSTLTP